VFDSTASAVRLCIRPGSKPKRVGPALAKSMISLPLLGLTYQQTSYNIMYRCCCCSSQGVSYYPLNSTYIASMGSPKGPCPDATSGFFNKLMFRSVLGGIGVLGPIAPTAERQCEPTGCADCTTLLHNAYVCKLQVCSIITDTS
jgi:hypothetical protein